jgi:hypothetical protein
MQSDLVISLKIIAFSKIKNNATVFPLELTKEQKNLTVFN